MLQKGKRTLCLYTVFVNLVITFILLRICINSLNFVYNNIYKYASFLIHNFVIINFVTLVIIKYIMYRIVKTVDSAMRRKLDRAFKKLKKNRDESKQTDKHINGFLEL